MSDKEKTYAYGKLNTKELKCDPAYQRPIDTKRVKTIAEHFNPNRVNAIKVSHRDGAYWIFDGQHTARALVMKNDGNDLIVDCKIYEGLTQQDEAELFAKQNEYEKRLQKADEIKALYASGNKEIIEMKKAIESAGFIFDFGKSQELNRIICYEAILNIYKKSRESDFNNLLKILRDSWGGSVESLRGTIVGGVWLFYMTFKEDISIDDMISTFSHISPLEVYRDRAMYKEFHGNTKFAYIFAVKFNARKRKNKVDVNKLMK